MKRRALWIWLTVLCPAFGIRGARAHDFPTPFELIFGEPSRVIVALRPGLVLSENAGQSWNFLCGSVTGIAGSETYPVALGSDGVLWVGAFAGLYRDDGFGCSWSRVDVQGLPMGRVVGISTEGDRVEVLTAATGAENGLYVSRDSGRSWELQSAPLPAGAAPSGYRRVQDRVYVTGSAETGAVSWASHDGGSSWETHPIAQGFRGQIVGVDPRNSDRLAVWLVPDDPLLRERVMVSDDAGRTYRQLIEVLAFGGLAWDSSIWVGDRAGGLSRIDDDGAVDRVQHSLRVGCVAVRDGKLWVCANDGGGVDPFAVATSTDGGKTFTPFLHSEQVQRLRTCGNPNQAATCGGEWAQWKNDVFGSTDEPPLLPVVPDAGLSTTDAGAPRDAAVPRDAAADVDAAARDAGVDGRKTPPSPAKVSSGCQVARRSASVAGYLIAFAVALFARRRARERPYDWTAPRRRSWD